MRILFSVHMYPPHHNCGAESYIHAMAKFLQQNGHNIRILLHNPARYNIKQIYTYEGIEVWPVGKGVEEHFMWANAVFTHLDFTKWTMEICRVFKKTCYFIVHNTSEVYDYINDARYEKARVIYNTEAARGMLKYNKPNIVLHPPVDITKYDIDHNPVNNRFISLISLNKNKGGEIFYKIAEAMPNKMF